MLTDYRTSFNKKIFSGISLVGKPSLENTLVDNFLWERLLWERLLWERLLWDNLHWDNLPWDTLLLDNLLRDTLLVSSRILSFGMGGQPSMGESPVGMTPSIITSGSSTASRRDVEDVEFFCWIYSYSLHAKLVTPGLVPGDRLYCCKTGDPPVSPVCPLIPYSSPTDDQQQATPVGEITIGGISGG